MALAINPTLPLERLVAKLCKARGVHIIIIEMDDEGLTVEARCSAQDLTNSAFETLRLNARLEDLTERTGCPTCDERRRRAGEALAILGCPSIRKGHVH